MTTVNIHAAINYKGWRSGIISRLMEDIKPFYKGQRSYSLDSLESSKYPNNNYGLYHSHYGKNHSKYPNF